MKLNQLRKIIREEVKSAVKEELQDMLTEAIKIASKPETPIKQPTTVGHRSNSITEMINQTRASMTNDEYKNVVLGTSDMVQKPNFATSMANTMGMTSQAGPMPGIDISKLDFVRKASAVYNASVEKDKQKVGTV